jgi:hypothetical protein
MALLHIVIVDRSIVLSSQQHTNDCINILIAHNFEHIVKLL